ncbi:MAG: methyltransferase, FkbM family [Labilithrix sp.]|nr:methyltransferase, FkbM family [Labilithrix sp.]
MFAACTIVARNYLAQAHVLVSSFREHHPDLPFYTLVVDGVEEDRARTTVGTVVLPADLSLPPRVLHNMVAMYDVMELATALKPALLMHLVRRGAPAAAYFDPDIRVYARLLDVFSTARAHGMLLTPHTLQPVPRDGKNLTEQNIMQAGMYNLGFIAVGASAYRFLNWWHERLQTDAIVDVVNGLFTDQRWVDWAPSLFPHRISRDPGLNAAYWNLHDRPIRKGGDRFTAGGSPLRFFHFSGYDPATPWLLSKHFGDQPRTLLSEEPALAELCDAYGRELEAAGHIELRRNPYLLDRLPNGLRLTHELRRIFRDVILARVRAPIAPPDPVIEPDEFAKWLLKPMFGLGPSYLTPADLATWRSRGDLQAAFPDIEGRDARAFVEWRDHDAGARGQRAAILAACHAPDGEVYEPASIREASRLGFGWNVIAYANAELGVGEAGRRTASMVLRTGLPTALVAAPSGHFSREAHQPKLRVTSQLSYENAIVCVNADQVPRVNAIMRLDALRGRRIGLWFWELSEFPAMWRSAFDHVDEVWTTSEFTRSAVASATEKPVRVVPLPIEPPSEPTSFTRRSVGLGETDAFTFVVNFDYLSLHRRKNPVGAILAYSAAFAESDGARLIVKSINGHLRPLDVEHVKSFAGKRTDIVFQDRYVSSSAMKAMIELSDAYVSLHRSEGYGLNLADAMAVGTPTIATSYSGNLDFMDATTAELIPYSLTEVGPGAHPYDASALWAEPDLDAAADAMRRLFDSPDYAAALAARARDHVGRNFSLGETAKVVRPLLMDMFEDGGE